MSGRAPEGTTDDAVVSAAVAGRSSADLRTLAMAITLLALLGTLFFPQPAAADLPSVGATVLVGGAVMALLRRPAFERYWPIAAPAITAAFVAVVVAFTGGVDSHYADLYIISLVVAGLVQPLARVVLSLVVVTVAAALPAFYGDIDRLFVTDLVADLVIWAGVTLLVYRQSAGLRRREREIRVSEARFRGLSEDLHDVVYEQTLEPQRAFTYVNPAVEEVCGVTPAELYEDPDLPLSLVHPADAHIVLRTRSATEAVQVVYRWSHPERGLVWLDERISPVTDASDRVVAQRSIVRDVTAEREAAERRERLLAQEEALVAELRGVEQLRRTLLQNLSHEVRTPLTVLMGSIELLREGDGLPAPAVVSRILPSMSRHADRLKGLFDDVLILANEEPVEGLSPEVRQLDDLVLEELAQVDLGPRVVDVASSGVEAPLDASAFRRLVRHLLMNVARHTPATSDVGVRIATGRVDGQVQLTVTDTGPGWPTRDPQQLLQPFAQGPEASGSADPGAGFGLSVVSQVARLHGGTVRLADGPGGVGTLVEVRLPAATA